MKKAVASFMIIAAAFSVFIGCGQNNPFSSISDNETSVSIALPGGAQSQTITAEAAAVASGEVTLTKVSTGESIVKTGPAGSTVRFNKILPGAYTVTVKLFDSAGELLYEGNASVNAVSGVTVPVNVTVTSKGGSISVGVIIDDSDPIANGIIFWNTLDSQSSIEASIVGVNGTITLPDASYASGMHGNGVSFPASRVSLSDKIAFVNQQFPSEGTFECWVKPNFSTTLPGSRIATSDGAAHTVIHPYLFEDMNYGLMIWVVPGEGMHFDLLANNGSYNRLTIQPVLNAGELVHIAYTWKNGEQKVYLNGILMATGTAGFDFADKTFSFQLGNEVNHNDWGFNGVIDNVKIWNIVKTDFSDRMTE